VCRPANFDGKRAGLLWIGEQYYETPFDFMKEASELGISRRIQSVPHGFKIGETWVLLAHAWAKSDTVVVEGDNPAVIRKVPGIFAVFRPTRIEKMVKQSTMDNYQQEVEIRAEYGDDEKEEIATPWREDYLGIRRLIERGITPVPLPDDDPDHQAETRVGGVRGDDE
jgi:hypothetical protein